MPPTAGICPYADPSAEKLKVILQFNDFTISQYNLRLKIEIKGNGFVLSTKAFYNQPPLILQPGVPMLSATDPDHDATATNGNLDFTGINRS